jgi:hypothetical protein
MMRRLSRIIQVAQYLRLPVCDQSKKPKQTSKAPPLH